MAGNRINGAFSIFAILDEPCVQLTVFTQEHLSGCDINQLRAVLCYFDESVDHSFINDRDYMVETLVGKRVVPPNWGQEKCLEDMMFDYQVSKFI